MKNTSMNTENTYISTVNTFMNTVNTSMNTVNTFMNTVNTFMNTVNTSMNTVNTSMKVQFCRCTYIGLASTLKKSTHIKGRLLYQAMTLYNNVLFFKMGTSFQGKNLLPDGANFFL